MRKIFLLVLILISSNSILAFSHSKELFISNSLEYFKNYVLKSNKSHVSGNVLSVDEIYSDYTNNELAANKKYKDKNLRIKTTINQIKEDAFGNAFIISKIKNSMIGSAHFKVNEKDPKILELSKNDTVDLMCKFDEFSLDSLSFNQCIFTEQFLDKILNPIKENLLKAHSQDYKPQSQMEGMLSLIATDFPDDVLNKVCENDVKNCNMDNIKKSKFYPKTKSKESNDLDAHMKTLIDKYGKEWFKSLPKFPEVE